MSTFAETLLENREKREIANHVGIPIDVTGENMKLILDEFKPVGSFISNADDDIFGFDDEDAFYLENSDGDVLFCFTVHLIIGGKSSARFQIYKYIDEHTFDSLQDSNLGGRILADDATLCPICNTGLTENIDDTEPSFSWRFRCSSLHPFVEYPVPAVDEDSSSDTSEGCYDADFKF